MTNLLIWTGPVMASNLNGVALPADTQVLTLGCTGSECGQNAQPLSSLLAAHGLSRSQFDKVVVSGFSAAHNGLNPLLGYDDDVENRVDGAVLLDACFGLAGSPAKGGYTSYAAKAAAGKRVMVSTASAGQNGPGLPPSTTGFECAIYNAQQGAAAVGMLMSPWTPPADMAPGVGYRAGNLIVIDYSDNYNNGFLHGDLVNKIGVTTLNDFLVPILDGTFQSEGGVWKYVAGVLGLAAGVALGTYLSEEYL